MDAIGGFSERCRTSMDYDLWIRMLARTRRMARVPEVLAFYRWHGAAQISAVKWRQVVDAWSVKRDFCARNPGLVAQLQPSRLADLVDGTLLRAAYEAYWQRNLESAQTLFRAALRIRAVGPRDLKYVLPSLLPRGTYRALLRLKDAHYG